MIDFKILVVAALSGITGYMAYQRSGLLAGVLATIFAVIIIGSLSSGIGIWNSLGALTNPFIGLFIFFMLGFLYYTFNGDQVLLSISRSVAVALLGTAFSMLLFKYWNI